MNLKTRMIALIGTPVLLVFIVMAGIVYEILMDSMEQEMTEMATHHASDINGKLIGKKEMLAAVTRAWDAKLPSYEDMQTTANYFANKNGIGDFFIGFPNQPFIDGADKTSDPTFDATGRAWYKDAAASQDVKISKIYLTKTDHKPVVSLSSAFRQNGQVAGVAGFDLSLDAVEDFVSSIKVGETGGAFLVNEEGNFIYHKTKTIDDTILDEKENAEAIKAFFQGKPTIASWSEAGTTMLFASAPVGDTGWVLVLEVPKSEILAPIMKMGAIVAVVILLSIAMLIAIILYITRSIATPITELGKIAEQVAEGNLSHKFSDTDRQDEIGRLHQSFAKMSKNLHDLVQRSLKAADQLAASSEELTSSAGQSANASQSAAEAVTHIAQSAQQQNDIVDRSIDSVNAMSDEMSQVVDVIHDVASSAAETHKATTEGQSGLHVAVEGMETINGSTKEVADAVNSLYEGSKRISEIVEMITQIASQTNLLALNAAIEAARAGESGKGFAVVAEEVRKLAEQSETAAQQITTLITENSSQIERTFSIMQQQKERVGEGVTQVNEAGKKFDRIAELVQGLSERVKSIETLTQRVRQGSTQTVSSVQEIKSASNDVRKEAENVSAVSEEQAASTQEIAAASQTLSQLAHELKETVGRFRV
ncbi:methyl-accepting chemotaxis protein [uncultured Selenomonas sp.]|uniref:methyl-accepting chemotaxis protein n=1 Tax=uncultured Selenomonas sp. TaxID=159275 RepID=UPI00260F3F49|nr:methyl-accepting chemotaxis protein [uncultured Selenomonas sp.]